MDREALIQRTKAYVREALKGAEGGHDWSHVQRVHRNALLLLEGEPADALVVELAALLHDLADAKFHAGDEALGGRLAGSFLRGQGVDPATIGQVVDLIGTLSYRHSLGEGPRPDPSMELKILQDADRLDALGAVGIARAFSYGGFKNRPLHDPKVPPNPGLDKEAYQKSTAPTINHFYEKLLLLKDGMHTLTAQRLAARRHAFMEEFLDRFLREWDGKD